MSVTLPFVVAMVKEPRALADRRPTWVPAFLSRAGTTARTRSPVRNPCVKCLAFGAVRGNPKRSIKHICRQPCPLALICRGTILFASIASGVERPTQAASSQWAFDNPLCILLNFVSPPQPHSTGKRILWIRLISEGGNHPFVRLRLSNLGFR